MAKLEYSQIVRNKLKKLKEELEQSYGKEKARIILQKITRKVRQLEIFPESGPRVSSLYPVESDYRYIYAGQNYFFYRMKDEKTVLVLEMFHEKEDFMRKLFGVTTTSDETLDYWGE